MQPEPVNNTTATADFESRDRVSRTKAQTVRVRVLILSFYLHLSPGADMNKIIKDPPASPADYKDVLLGCVRRARFWGSVWGCCVLLLLHAKGQRNEGKGEGLSKIFGVILVAWIRRDT